METQVIRLQAAQVILLSWGQGVIMSVVGLGMTQLMRVPVLQLFMEMAGKIQLRQRMLDLIRQNI